MLAIRYTLRFVCLCGAIFLSACVHMGDQDGGQQKTDGVIVEKIGDIESEPVTEMAAVIDVKTHTGEHNIQIVDVANPNSLNRINVAAGKEEPTE